MRIILSIALFILAVPLFSQNLPDAPSDSTIHYPNLVHAELPLYPPIAWSAHIAGSVEIKVTVEKGSVVDAQVKSVEIHILGPDHPPKNDSRTKSAVSSYLLDPSLANVKTWQFQPRRRTTFVVKYVYRIEGKQTLRPENPKIELDLPTIVRITARPFEPTISH